MKKAVIFIVTIVFMFSCKTKNEESNINQTPTIHILNQSVPMESEYLCEAMFDNVLKLNTGESFQITLEFQAENPLSQYKIDIHNNFDCHSHGKSTAWTVLKVEDLEKNHEIVQEELIVPEDAAVGNYHFMIQLLDIYGNEAEIKEFNIILTNPEDQTPPQISIDSPLENSICSHSENVAITGEITDNLSLKNGKFEVKFTDANNQNYSLYEIFYPSETTTSYSIDTSYTIGTFMAIGEGYFTIKAYDNINNFSTEIIPITIQ